VKRFQVLLALRRDSSIVEMLGWGVESGSRMLHRYVGRAPLSTLKSYPPILDRVIGTVA
jgi:hypothetical protein